MADDASAIDAGDAMITEEQPGATVSQPIQEVKPDDVSRGGPRDFAIKGILPVVQTPFAEQGGLDQEGLRWLVNDAIEAGAKGLLATAVASEVAYLSRAEREVVLAEIVAATTGRVSLIVGASSEMVTECRHFARKALELGATAYLVAVPGALYRQPEAIIPFFREVSLGSELPLIVQDFEINGPGMTLSLIHQLREAVPALAGIKIETAPAGPKYSAVRNAFGPDFFIAGGWAVPQFIEALDRGVDAMVPESSMVRVYAAIHRCYLAGRRAQAREIFNALLPILAFTNQELTTSIAFFKRLLVRKRIFSSGQLRMPGFVWDQYNTRIADELIEHYLALEQRVLREGT